MPAPGARIFQSRPWVLPLLIIFLIIVVGGIVVAFALPIGTFEERFYLILPLFSVYLMGMIWVLWEYFEKKDWLILTPAGLQKGKSGPFIPWKDIVEIKITTLSDMTRGSLFIKFDGPRISVDIRDNADCLKDFDFTDRLAAATHKPEGFGEMAINPIPYKETTSEVFDALTEFYIDAVPTARRVGDRCGTEINYD